MTVNVYDIEQVSATGRIEAGEEKISLQFCIFILAFGGLV